MRVVGGLREEFQDRIGFRLSIRLAWDAVQVGQDWDAVTDGFRRWISDDAASLPDGRHKLASARDIPFPFTVHKQTDRPPGVYFGRIAPEDNALPERVRARINDKADKLRPYKVEGYTTVLLLESGDIALMSEGLLVRAIASAYPQGCPSHLDQLWYVDTSVPESPPVFRELTDRLGT